MDILKPAAVTAAAALLVGTGALIGNATTPTPDPLQACVNNTGRMRLVEYGQQCRKPERPVTWNAQGPAAQGGLRDYESVVARGTVTGSGPFPGDVVGWTAAARCPDGKVALGGMGHGTVRSGQTFTPALVRETGFADFAEDGTRFPTTASFVFGRHDLAPFRSTDVLTWLVQVTCAAP